MNNANKTNLAYSLDAITPLIESFGVGILSSDFAWSIILGVFPCRGSEYEILAMEINRRDRTNHKVENIGRITELASLLAVRPDYSDSNITDFTFAVRQLIRYTMGDEVATASLKDLKDIYVSFITSYYSQSVIFGKKEEALKNLKLFGEEILHEDSYISKRLGKIVLYKFLS